MKRIMITFSLIFLFISVYSQRAQFGVKGGLNISTLRADVDRYDSKVGIHAGGLVHIHLSDQFALQPELLYSMQGGDRKNINPDSKIKLAYLNIPVLVQYMFQNGFRLQTGPQAGLLLDAKNRINGVDLNIMDNLNTFDLSWAIGAGYISKKRIGADIRYNFGITDINESGSPAPDIKNGVLQIGIFYHFRRK